MIKKLFVFLFVGLFVALFSKPAFADNNFDTSFDITYSVNTNGTTHAVFNGNMTNLNNNVYAPSYSLKLGFTDLSNVTAYDAYGKIDPIVKDDANNKIVTLTFNRKIIGKGNSINFAFAFDTNELATHMGNIWEVNIPGLANQTDFKNFTVHLRVPDTFGKPAYIKPIQTGTSLDFDKNTLGSGGISLAFGTNQIYGFTLYYHLENKNIFPVKTEIALPPTTNYQAVQISDIVPRPLNVTQDRDGNWIAQYSLLPSQRLTVTAKGNVFVSLHPTAEDLSNDMRNIYLQPQQFWQSNSQDIQKLAKDLKTPDAIYAYVSNQLTYDFSRVAGKQQRVGAEGVLQNPTSAVCLEFTDLFIAIARAAGIPAREVDGYAYTQNTKERPLLLTKDILHTWPEYYDDTQKKWIMIDPTWGNTTHGIDYFHTLDFDHVAFAIKGISSTYPIPAGGYKFSNAHDAKDVYVTFTPEVVQNDAKISVNLNLPSSLLSGFPINGNLVIRNVGDTLVPSQDFVVASDKLTPGKQTITTRPIPPFGYINNQIGFQQTSFLTNITSLITIQVAGETLTKTVVVHSFFWSNKYPIIGGLILAAIFCFTIFILAAKSRRIPLSK